MHGWSGACAALVAQLHNSASPEQRDMTMQTVQRLFLRKER